MLNQEVPAADRREAPARFHRLPWWVLVPAAALTWYVVGFLAWLVDGLGDAGASLAVPLLTGAMSTLVMGGVVGGVAAGLLSAAGPAGLRARSVLATLAGTTLALVVALVTSANRLDSAAFRDFDGDSRVTTGLVVGAVVATAIGWAAGALVVVGRPGLGIALALLAGMLPSWLSSLVFAVLPPPQEAMAVLGQVWGWLAVGLLAAALVVVGARPSARWAWWPLLVAITWFTGPVLVALVYLSPLLRPGAGLPGTLPDSLDAAAQVFREASSPDARDLWPWGVALVLAAIVALARARRTTRVTPRPDDGAGPR
jgi:hypothetical protein